MNADTVLNWGAEPAVGTKLFHREERRWHCRYLQRGDRECRGHVARLVRRTERYNWTIGRAAPTVEVKLSARSGWWHPITDYTFSEQPSMPPGVALDRHSVRAPR